MRFTIFNSLRDNRPTTLSGWKRFIKKLQPPLVLERKDDAPLYCPAVYIEGGTRTIEQVLYVSFGVIDIDHATEQQVIELLEALEELGIAFIYHTSYRYSQYLAEEGLNKCRIIFRFSRPVDPEEWDRVWYMLNELCDGLGDVACRNPNAIYFFPSHPPDGDGEVVVFDGEPVDVDWLLENCPDDIETQQTSTFRAPSDELLARIDVETRYGLAKTLIEQFPKAVVGEGGDRTTLKAAYIGHDFALTKEQFWPLLQWYNQHKCFRDGKAGSWNERKLAKKLDNAYKYSRMPFGWRLAGQERPDSIADTDLEKYAKKLQNSKVKALQADGRVLRSMLSGVPVQEADPVRTFGRMARILAGEFTLTNPDQIASHFGDCIDATAHRDMTVEIFSERIKAAQEEIQARENKARQLAKEEETTVIQLAFLRIGEERSTAYSKEEIKEMAKPFANLLHFNHHWVIRKGKSFYFWLKDRYVGPFMAEEAMNAARQLLAPARLDMEEITPQGKRPLGLQGLVDRYGTMADEVVADMTIQRSYYDVKTSTLHEATCPMRDIEPKQHEEVHEWLWRLCSRKKRLFGKMCDWLAVLPLVEEPVAALFFYGAAGTGKSLFAHACSRLWTEHGPTELDDVAGAFNSKLAKCPVVLGDEGPPKDNRGDPKTTLLRRIIQEHSRTYRRKHLPDATLKGAMRVILAANSLDVLISDVATLNNWDISAINERFLLIPVENSQARKYLDSLPPKVKRRITHGTALVEHALWIGTQRKVKKGDRLMVHGLAGSELEKRMTTSTGMRADLCMWIGSYLLKPERIRAQGKGPVVAKVDNRNRLLLSANIVFSHWGCYLNDHHKPRNPQQISNALVGLSSEGRKKYKGHQYRAINLDAVRSWCCETADICSEEEFDAALAKHHLTPLRLVEGDD